MIIQRKVYYLRSTIIRTHMCERDRVKSSQHIFLTVRPRFEKKFQCVGLTPCYFRYVPVRVFENSGDFGEGKNTYVSRFADSAI